MQNRYCVRIGNAHIKSTLCWIANIIVSPVISSDLGDVPWLQHWRKCGHDQEPLTGILLIIITVKMTGKISLMPDGKYWADCRLNGGSGPFLESRNFRIFLNYHWWDLINTKLHHLRNIAHCLSGSRLPYRLKYRRCNFFATSRIYRRCRSLHRPPALYVSETLWSKFLPENICCRSRYWTCLLQVTSWTPYHRGQSFRAAIL
jgi:hypothetical protein